MADPTTPIQTPEQVLRLALEAYQAHNQCQDEHSQALFDNAAAALSLPAAAVPTDDMVPRSRLKAVERELEEMRTELQRVRDVARPYMEADLASPASAAAPSYEGPKKWTPEEVAWGNKGIRWVTETHVAGRPTQHDIREYLLARGEDAACSCPECRAFFVTSTLPSAPAAPYPTDLDLLLDALGAMTDGDDRFDSSVYEGPERDELQSMYEAVKSRRMAQLARPAPTGGEAEQLQTEPSLIEIDELARVYSSSYASPHHIAFTVEGLRSLFVHLAASQSVRTSGEALGTVPSAQELADALRLVLPMAKGYAYAHPVGTNAEKVEHAESVLRATAQGEDSATGAASPEVLPASPDVQDPSRVSATSTDGGNQ